MLMIVNFNKLEKPSLASIMIAGVKISLVILEKALCERLKANLN